MAVKKLQQKNNWPQEQLTSFCGVSLRTIQRFEAGNSASLDTLRSLTSVFEIDKDDAEWKAKPIWVEVSLVSIKNTMAYDDNRIFFATRRVLVLRTVTFNDSGIIFFTYLNAKLLAYIDMKNY